MTNKHAILVCSTCASVWENGKRVGICGGEKLFKELSNLSQQWSGLEEFEIKSVECMSACSQSCVVAFTSPGKFTYLFGGLSHFSEDLPAISNAVLDCADLYLSKSDGMMAWSERPELLKKGIIARIPG